MKKTSFGYKQLMTSAMLNERFADIAGGSILNGFRLAKGTGNYTISLRRGNDKPSTLITNDGVRLMETTDVVDAVIIKPNTGVLNRYDVLYVAWRQDVGGDITFDYAVVEGLPGQPANIETNPSNRLAIGHVCVRPDAPISHEDLTSFDIGLKFGVLYANGILINGTPMLTKAYVDDELEKKNERLLLTEDELEAARKTYPDLNDRLTAELEQKIDIGELFDLNNDVNKLKEDHNDILLYSFFKSSTDLSNALYLSNNGFDLIKLNLSNIGLKSLRDPSIAYFKGYFYVSHTGYNPHDFVISKSSDLNNWTSYNISVGLNGSPSSRVWAPELFVDGETLYVLMSKQVGEQVDIEGTTVPSFRTYITKMTNEDTMSFSNAEMITIEDTNKIDPCLIFHDGYYQLFIKDEFDKKIEHWKSLSIKGPYSKVSDAISDMQYTEGCSITYFKGEFYLYGDAYKSDRGISYCVKSSDLVSWSSKKQVKAGEKIRHGSVLRVDDEQAKNVILKYRSANEIKMNKRRDILIPLGDLATNGVVNMLEIIDEATYTISGSDKITINGFSNVNEAKNFYFHIASATDASLTIASGSSIIGINSGTVFDAALGEGDSLIRFEYMDSMKVFKTNSIPLKKILAASKVGAKMGWKRVDFTTIGLSQSNLAVEDGVIYVLTGSSDATLSGVQSLPDGSRFGVAVFSAAAKLTITSGNNITVPGGSFIVGSTNGNHDSIVEFVKVSSSTFRLLR